MASSTCCPTDSHAAKSDTGGGLFPNEDNVSLGSLGSVVTLNDSSLNAYVVGDGPSAVVVIYDIFGFTSGRTRYFCDWLAKNSKYTVILPDFFRGEGWDPKKIPSDHRPELMEWIKKVGTWDEVVKPDLVTMSFLF